MLAVWWQGHFSPPLQSLPRFTQTPLFWLSKHSTPLPIPLVYVPCQPQYQTSTNQHSYTTININHQSIHTHIKTHTQQSTPNNTKHHSYETTFTLLLWIVHPASANTPLISLKCFTTLGKVLTHQCLHSTTVSLAHCIFSFSFCYQFIIALQLNHFITHTLTLHCFNCCYNQNPNTHALWLWTTFSRGKDENPKPSYFGIFNMLLHSFMDVIQ